MYNRQSLILPCVVGASGVERILPLSLREEELNALHRSADAVRAMTLEADLQLV